MGRQEGEQRRKRDEYIERRNKTWSEGERDGGVLIREATVMPRPTTTTLLPPLAGFIFSQLYGKSFAIEEYLSIVKMYDSHFNVRSKESRKMSYIKLQNLV